MKPFKFLTRKIKFVTYNQLHGIDMDHVCMMYLRHCYRNQLNFHDVNPYPLESLNLPFVNHYIKVNELTRAIDTFRDYIKINYKILEINATMPYNFYYEISMIDFENLILQ